MPTFISKLTKRSPSIGKKDFNLREYYEKRNSILIIRGNGGLGDILVHRMLFEDFKRVMPDAKMCFACPASFHQAVVDHPYIDELLDSATVEAGKYVQAYNTSNACARYELAVAPLSGMNRSDIWANHCGINLTNHEMHITLEKEIKELAKEEVEAHRDSHGSAVLFTPISAMLNKNLVRKQIVEVVNALRSKGLYVYSSHTTSIPVLQDMGVPVLKGNIRQWMGYVDAADYVISVDTATIHMAGGIKKPLTGIFSFTDGKVYMKYYPTAELVQKHRDDGWDCGPCYNWPTCKKTKANPKPCLTEITVEMIMKGVNKMLMRFPKHANTD